MRPLYSERVFPRASRTDCTRTAEPLAGPYRAGGINSAGHRVVTWLGAAGLVAFLVAGLAGWLQ